MDAYNYPANPYTSDDAISRAKSRILIGCVSELLKHEACVHGIDEHGDLYRCWIDDINSTYNSIQLIIPPEHINTCIRLLGCDSEILSQPHEPLVIRWRTHVHEGMTSGHIPEGPHTLTYTVTFGLIDSLYEEPHPTVEQIFLYAYRSEPTWGVFYRSIELPDVFGALDHLYTKQYIIAHTHAHGPNADTCKGDPKKFLTKLWQWLDKGFQPSSSSQTQQFIRSKISAACSLALQLTPLIKRSLDAFYDEIPPTVTYQRGRVRGESMYFISQLVHAPTPNVEQLIAEGRIAKALQYALRQDPKHIDKCIAAANRQPASLGFAFDELAPEIIPFLPRLNTAWTQTDVMNMCKHGCGEHLLGYQLCDKVVDWPFIYEYSPADQYIDAIIENGDKQLIMYHCARLQTMPKRDVTAKIIAAIGRHPHVTWLALNAHPDVFMAYVAGHHAPSCLLCATPYGGTDLITALQQPRFAVHLHVFREKYP
jgi:hypothetical protein